MVAKEMAKLTKITWDKEARKVPDIYKSLFLNEK